MRQISAMGTLMRLSRLSLVYGLFLLALPGCPKAPDMDDMGPRDLRMDPVIYDFRDVDMKLSPQCEMLMCQGTTPICRGDRCDKCNGDGDCQALGKPEKWCQTAGTNAGKCLVCLDDTKDAQCKLLAANGLTCKSGACTACEKHADCLSNICDFYQSGDGTGRCIQAPVIQVQSKTELVAALASPANPVYIRLLAGSYDDVAITSLTGAPSACNPDMGAAGAKTVFLYGPGPGETGEAKFDGKNVAGKAALSIKADGCIDLTVDGIDVQGGSPGISCEGGATTLRVRRSSIHDNLSTGMRNKDCVLTLDRSRVSKNRVIGISVDSANYTISNNFIVDNLGPEAAVKLTNKDGTFQFNTVANNVSSSYGGIDCLDGPLTIRDSIFVGNARPTGESQIFRCPKRANIVVETGDPLAVMNAPANAAGLFVSPATGDYKVKAGSSCCIDATDGIPGRPVATDYFGTKRPKGLKYDIGAHEQ